jgi:NADH oxidase (H2O2-forming)
VQVGIIGSGIAGYSTAQAIRQTGGKVTCTLFSEENVPTYSACVLAEYIAGDIPREHVFLKRSNHDTFTDSELLLGKSVIDLDLHNRCLYLDSGKAMRFDRLIMATGARPVLPKLPGVEKTGVYCLKTLSDADGIIQAQGKGAVIVGSGPIGLEVAAALQKKGWETHVIEIVDRILPRLFSEVQSDLLRTLLEEHGVRVWTGEQVLEITGEQSVEAVVTDKRTLPCQLVVLVVGMRPETTLAERSGIRLGITGGIQVDERMRTSHEDVFACGDCVESIDRLTGKPALNMLWGNAKLQGMVAGLNSVGREKKYPGALNITTVTLYDTMATSVGKVTLCDETYHEIVRQHGMRYTIRLVVKDGLIKGIQAVGPKVDMSIFLHMMLGGERLTILTESRDPWSILKQKPWLVRLPSYFRE